MLVSLWLSIRPAPRPRSGPHTVRCYLRIWTNSSAQTENLSSSGSQPVLQDNSRNLPRCGSTRARRGPRTQADVGPEISFPIWGKMNNVRSALVLQRGRDCCFKCLLFYRWICSVNPRCNQKTAANPSAVGQQLQVTTVPGWWENIKPETINVKGRKVGFGETSGTCPPLKPQGKLVSCLNNYWPI